MIEVKVRVNDAIARYGGAFTDVSQPEGYPRIIGPEPVVVVLTPQVSAWLARGEIVRVEEAPSEPLAGTEWPEGFRSDIAKLLEGYGIRPEHLPNMSDEELLQLEGLGQKRLEIIRQYFPRA